jgi:hypothetical protein
MNPEMGKAKVCDKPDTSDRLLLAGKPIAGNMLGGCY